jgi:hypothetical protein
MRGERGKRHGGEYRLLFPDVEAAAKKFSKRSKANRLAQDFDTGFLISYIITLVGHLHLQTGLKCRTCSNVPCAGINFKLERPFQFCHWVINVCMALSVM